jgi:hypothetical protein
MELSRCCSVLAPHGGPVELPDQADRRGLLQQHRSMTERVALFVTVSHARSSGAVAT